MKEFKEENTKGSHNASKSPELINPDPYHLSFGKYCSNEPSHFFSTIKVENKTVKFLASSRSYLLFSLV
jgi:hypothetical protein